jgi:hypothetical protein
MLRQVMNLRQKALDKLIDSVEAEMLTTDPSSEDYLVLMESLERLRKMQADKKPARLDRNTILLVAGNLLGILIIVMYEQKHVMTSKALVERIKPKIQ